MEAASVDIRQYLFMLKRHWVLSGFIFLAVLAAGLAYCIFWPKTYEAQALIVVQPQKVPGEIVSATVTTKVEERLQIITQQVLSRTRLTEIIDRFELYPRMRGKVTPDEMAEKMRKDVTIKISRKNYFTITYIYTDAKKAAAVTNALASFYVDSNLRLREQDAVGTARFLAQQLETRRASLSEWESRITKFKQEHLNELPEAQEKNLLVLDQYRRNYEHSQARIQQERSLIAFNEGQISRNTAKIQDLELRRAWQRKHGQASSGGGSGQGDSEPESIKQEIERLRVLYTDDHPDLQRLRRHLKKAEAQKEAQRAARKAASGSEEEPPGELDLQIGSLRANNKRIATQVAEGKIRIDKYEAAGEQASRNVKMVRGWIANGPSIAEQLKELTRGYDVEKQAYEKLHAKWLEATVAANLERTQRGEQFEVVDPAQVPDSPYQPNLGRALPVTFILALGLGVGIAFLLNFLDTSFTSVSQVEKLSELPVLVVIPPLLTRGERARRRSKNLFVGAVYFVVFIGLMGVAALLFTGLDQTIRNYIAGFLA